MFIVTHKPEYSIWITETPFNRKSGVWHFYDNEEDYLSDLSIYKLLYGSKFLIPLKRIEKMYKERGESDATE